MIPNNVEPILVDRGGTVQPLRDTSSPFNLQNLKGSSTFNIWTIWVVLQNSSPVDMSWCDSFPQPELNAQSPLSLNASPSPRSLNTPKECFDFTPWCWMKSSVSHILSEIHWAKAMFEWYQCSLLSCLSFVFQSLQLNVFQCIQSVPPDPTHMQLR